MDSVFGTSCRQRSRRDLVHLMLNCYIKQNVDRHENKRHFVFPSSGIVRFEVDLDSKMIRLEDRQLFRAHHSPHQALTLGVPTRTATSELI
jgi:hypothetical protein